MWRKSSRSGATGGCVVLRNDLAALRDSKHPETTLTADPTAITHLVSFAPHWRKSSHSGPTGNCVELRNDLAALRDSKHPETTLTANRTAITRLVSFARYVA